jgi:hypothetical protein
LFRREKILPMNRSIAAVSVAAAALTLAGCGGSQNRPSAANPARSAPTQTTTSSAATEPSPSTPTEAAPPTPKPELEDGRHFGYIKAVDVETSPNTLVFDLAYLLTGEDANREAAERGYPTPVDNDYFIVDDNPQLRTLALADELELRLLDWQNCCDTFFAGDLKRFAVSFDRKKPPFGNYKGRFSAYELTVEDGVVVRIDEHYFP